MRFQPMTDDAASAGAAYRCHRVNCALETIERHGPLAHSQLTPLKVVPALVLANPYLHTDLAKHPLPDILLDRLADLYWAERDAQLGV
jgi:hypothetical protein